MSRAHRPLGGSGPPVASHQCGGREGWGQGGAGCCVEGAELQVESSGDLPHKVKIRKATDLDVQEAQDGLF